MIRLCKWELIGRCTPESGTPCQWGFQHVNAEPLSRLDLDIMLALLRAEENAGALGEHSSQETIDWRTGNDLMGDVTSQVTTEHNQLGLAQSQGSSSVSGQQFKVVFR